jgi:signal transduction histidine kinase
MQNTHSDEQIDAWLEQATRDLSSKKIVMVFGDALKTLSNKASRSLNQLTLMAIVNRVLYQCKERYPLLQDLKVDNNGINFDHYQSQLEKSDPEELKNSFRYLFIELYNVLGDLTAEVVTPLVATVEENVQDDNALLRLDALYEISKLFVSFESVEKTFPQIFLRLGTLFAFKTISLLEKKNNSTLITVWHDPGSDNVCIENAVHHASQLYEYLVCPISGECIVNSAVKRNKLPICSLDRAGMNKDLNRYITLPLSLSSLETFGVLQFENLGHMSEADLRFINALCNLIAVTLDRFNKEQETEFIHQSELKKQAAELDIAQKYAVSLEKERELREQFVATLTHDLRTPLTAAKMGAQFILRRPDNEEKNQQLAVKIIRSIDRMDQMIKDLLDASRIRAGEGLTLTMNECDLREIALMTLRELVAAYGDRFVLETERDLILGYWNEDGLRRVIENLASNAVKYGTPQMFIKVSLRQNDNSAEICVHNTGDPIPRENLSRLFEPFQRAQSAQSSKKGWGLGLTLVKGVVEAHGGKINVVSSKEEGTSFTVTLPKDSRPYQILN